MKKILAFTLCLILFCLNFTIQAQNSGEEIYMSVCAACHTINKGRLVGPDLSGIYLIRSNDWIIRFVRSSQQLIKSGDTAAVAIFNEYNKIIMPDNKLSDEQILSIIEYIRGSDQNTSVTAVKPGTPTDSLTVIGKESSVAIDSITIKYSVEKVPEGRNLFYGYKRFANGAPPCISCHNINDQSVLGGGKLALDLTGAYIKLGPAGVNAILINSPFPAMNTAMVNHALTKSEIENVISLLKSVGEREYTNRMPDSSGMVFFTLAFVCALILLVHIYIFYDNRKIP